MESTNPADKIDQVAGTKPKKHLSKKAKLALIISGAVLVAAAIVVVLILFVFKKTEPVIVKTDRDILTAHAWEKDGAPTVIWTFRDDGSGEITTNKSNYYNMNWSLEQGEGESATQTLKITTNWLYDIEDTFTFSLDRDEDTFTVKNLADNIESVFLPLGTAEQKTAEPDAEELEKTEE
ncbi:hypothetical protein IKF74_01570 [Candidatus Saccharibacteria bacterium]|nr:hypothetical protein [Candidatus Saccharibacteria bacterium]